MTNSRTWRAVFLLSLIVSLMLILMYFFVNDNDSNTVTLLYSSSNNNIIKGKYIRYRLVNKHGIIIAQEQPDFNEINSVTDKYNENNSRPITNATTWRSSHNKTVTDISSVIEHDPTIDENLVAISYKYYANGNIRLSECTSETPIQKVALLSLHQTGNHIINNIFYSYGDFHNLYFALPKSPVFEYYWPLRFNPSYVDKSMLNWAKANFIVNAGRNDEANLRGILSSRTIYLAMLRDPIEQYRDVYNYVGMMHHMLRISPNKTEDENFEVFIEEPLKNIDRILNATQQFEPAFHLLKNPQLFDLGYEVTDYRSTHDMQEIIGDLEQQMPLVLLREYLDESLVLLQRLLCWQLPDMVYVKREATRNKVKRPQLSNKIKKNIRAWNHEDFLLYQHFNKTFWKQIRQEGDPMFWDDVTKLRKMSEEMDVECFMEDDQTENKKPKSLFAMLRKNINDELRPKCERLALEEKDYVSLLKIKQRQRINEQYDTMISNNYVTNGTNGKFLYALKFNGSEVESFDVSNAEEDITSKDGDEEVAKADILKL